MCCKIPVIHFTDQFDRLHLRLKIKIATRSSIKGHTLRFHIARIYTFQGRTLFLLIPPN